VDPDEKPLSPEELLEPDVVPELELVTAGLELVEELEATVEVALLFESAGSRPVTSITAINNHTATNTDTVPVITRFRIVRTRARRASRAAWPGAGRCWMGGVMCQVLVDGSKDRLHLASIRRVSYR